MFSNAVFLPLLVAFCQFPCHTVTHESNNQRPESVESFAKPVVESVSLKDQANFNNLTQNADVLSDRTSVDNSSNRTFFPLKPILANGELNSTQILPSWWPTIKSGALQRTAFVVLGFTLIVIVFFVVRSIRLRHKRSKSRKYGIITSTDMEMEPLDNDEDDDEDTTLFDAQHKYALQ